MTSNSATTHHNGVNGCNGNGSGQGHPDVGDRWPVDVGIVSMEVYFPNQFVEQSELEEFDGASTGHYTKGLLQTRMGFCGDNEDVNSLSLTVVDRLMRKVRGIFCHFNLESRSRSLCSLGYPTKISGCWKSERRP